MSNKKMKMVSVEITETLQKTVSFLIEESEDADKKVEEAYYRGDKEFSLNKENFIYVEFQIKVKE